MIRLIACLLTVLLFIPAGLSLAAEGREEAAVDAAQQWVALIDAGKYAESWDAAAELFRDSIRRADWVKSLGMVRAPLGNVIARKVRRTAHVTSLPGVPEGDYLIIEFDTSFDNRAAAIETITPARDADGNWRVAGYYIR